MIDIVETGAPKVIGLRMSGTLHDEDFRRFVRPMESIITEEGQLRLFIYLDDFHGWDMHAAWDDLKFSLRHHSDFERIAIVGDRSWEKWMANFCMPLTAATVKYFDKAESVSAWKWLSEADPADRAMEEKDRSMDLPDDSNSWPYVW